MDTRSGREVSTGITVMMVLEIHNHGPLITATNYWQTPHERAGKLICSTNAGAVRVLLPRSLFGVVGEVRASKYVICSRGPWPEKSLADAVELLFEDGGDSPYTIHLSASNFADGLPGAPDPGREWVATLWVLKHDRPHRAMERRCLWRRVPKIPCLAPWEKEVT